MTAGWVTNGTGWTGVRHLIYAEDRKPGLAILDAAGGAPEAQHVDGLQGAEQPRVNSMQELIICHNLRRQ